VGQAVGAPYAPQLGIGSVEISTALAAQRSGSAAAARVQPAAARPHCPSHGRRIKTKSKKRRRKISIKDRRLFSAVPRPYLALAHGASIHRDILDRKRMKHMHRCICLTCLTGLGRCPRGAGDSVEKLATRPACVLAGGASSKAQSRGGHWRTSASSAAPLPAPGVSARGGGVFG
jgi:hypothetical protein